MRALGLALLLAVPAWAFLVHRFDFVCDDAFISFRYAKNFAEGHGLRFNLGDPEARPVEGYTNFLWVILMAVVEVLRWDPAVWSRVLSIGCGAALLAWTTRTAQLRFELGTWSTCLVALFLGTLPTFAVYSTSGLATMAFGLAFFGLWERLLGDPDRPRALQAGLSGAFLVLLRADGMLFAGVIFGLAGLEAILTRRKALWRPIFVAGAITALVLGAHFLFRYATYGEWLPNTAHVKFMATNSPEAVAMRRERGLKYIATYLLSVFSVVCVPILAWLSASFPRGRRGLRTVIHATYVLTVFLGYGALVGGDFMTFGRFLLPAMPFVALLFAAFSNSVGESTPLRRGVNVVSSAGLIALSLLPVSPPSWNLRLFPKETFDRLHFRWNNAVERRQSEADRWADMDFNARRWIHEGQALGSIAKEGESLIGGGMGALSYYSGLTIYDRYALVNRDWASFRGEAKRKSPGHDLDLGLEYFLPQHPTFLHVFSMKVGEDPMTKLPKGFEQSPFGQMTTLEAHPYPPELGRNRVLYVLRFHRWE